VLEGQTLFDAQHYSDCSPSAELMTDTKLPDGQRVGWQTGNHRRCDAIVDVAEPPSQSALLSIMNSPQLKANPYLFPRELWVLERRARRQRESDHNTTAANSLAAATSTHAVATDDDGSVGHWWLTHCKPRQEKKLSEQLRALEVPHYLPVTECTAFTRGRPRVTLAPLFSGYLFIWGNSLQRRTALATNRIVASHRVGDDAELSEQLWTLADLIEKGIPLRVEERLIAGQRVRVKSGILKDKQGTILKRQGKTRLFVLVNELLGGVSLEIDQYLLEPY
jgi:transcriptional antiterminator RfaH